MYQSQAVEIQDNANGWFLRGMLYSQVPVDVENQVLIQQSATSTQHPGSMQPSCGVPSSMLYQPQVMFLPNDQQQLMCNSQQQQPPIILSREAIPAAAPVIINANNINFQQPPVMLKHEQQTPAIVNIQQQAPVVIRTDAAPAAPIIIDAGSINCQQPPAMMNNQQQPFSILNNQLQPTAMIKNEGYPPAMIKNQQPPETMRNMTLTTAVNSLQQTQTVLKNQQQPPDMTNLRHIPAVINPQAMVNIQQQASEMMNIQQHLQQAVANRNIHQKPQRGINNWQPPPVTISNNEKLPPAKAKLQPRPLVMRNIQPAPPKKANEQKPYANISQKPTALINDQQQYQAKTRNQQRPPTMMNLQQHPSSQININQQPPAMINNKQQPPIILRTGDGPTAAPVIINCQQPATMINNQQQPPIIVGTGPTTATAPVFIHANSINCQLPSLAINPGGPSHNSQLLPGFVNYKPDQTPYNSIMEQDHMYSIQPGGSFGYYPAPGQVPAGVKQQQAFMSTKRNASTMTVSRSSQRKPNSTRSSESPTIIPQAPVRPVSSSPNRPRIFVKSVDSLNSSWEQRQMSQNVQTDNKSTKRLPRLGEVSVVPVNDHSRSPQRTNTSKRLTPPLNQRRKSVEEITPPPLKLAPFRPQPEREPKRLKLPWPNMSVRIRSEDRLNVKFENGRETATVEIKHKPVICENMSGKSKLEDGGRRETDEKASKPNGQSVKLKDLRICLERCDGMYEVMKKIYRISSGVARKNEIAVKKDMGRKSSDITSKGAAGKNGRRGMTSDSSRSNESRGSKESCSISSGATPEATDHSIVNIEDDAPMDREHIMFDDVITNVFDRDYLEHVLSFIGQTLNSSGIKKDETTSRPTRTSTIKKHKTDV